MQKILFADRADFAVAEKARESERTEPLLHELGIVIRAAEQMLPAAIATTQAPAVNRRTANLGFGPREQRIHVLGRGVGITPLELHGLSRSRQGADGQHAGMGVAAQQVAHEEVAAMEIFEVFVDDEADEQISLRLALVLR